MMKRGVANGLVESVVNGLFQPVRSVDLKHGSVSVTTTTTVMMLMSRLANVPDQPLRVCIYPLTPFTRGGDSVAARSGNKVDDQQGEFDSCLRSRSQKTGRWGSLKEKIQENNGGFEGRIEVDQIREMCGISELKCSPRMDFAFEVVDGKGQVWCVGSV